MKKLTEKQTAALTALAAQERTYPSVWGKPVKHMLTASYVPVAAGTLGALERRGLVISLSSPFGPELLYKTTKAGRKTIS